MPYVYDPNLDEENQQQQTQSPAVKISGSSPTTDATGSPSNNKAAPNGSNQTGSGYQNLDTYLKANDAPAFGNEVIGKVSDAVNTAQTNQTNAAQQFSQRVQDANSVPTSDQINQAVANPTTADPTQYQKWENQSYTGPNSLSDTQDLWNQYNSGANQASNQTQLLNSEPGRFTLLDSYFGGSAHPNYTYGDKSLDNLLYQQSGVGAQAQGLQNQAAQLQSQGSTESQALTAQAQQRAAQVAQSNADARAAVGIDANGQVIQGTGALGTAEQNATQQLATDNAARAAQVTTLQQDLASGKLTPDEMQQLGITSPSSYGVSAASFFTPNQNTNLTLDQDLTPDQRAQIQALEGLSGMNDSFAGGTPLASSNPFTFNNSGYSTAIQGAQAQYAQDQVADYKAALQRAYPNSDLSAYNNTTPDQAMTQLQSAYLQRLSGQPVSALGNELADVYQQLQNQYQQPLSSVSNRNTNVKR